MYGLHVMAASGVAAGFVQGTGCLFLRLPTEPPAGVLGSADCAEVFSAMEWYAIAPWPNDLPREAGVHRLRELAAAAFGYARTLA